MATRERRQKEALAVSVWKTVNERADEFCARDLTEYFPNTKPATLSIILALLAARGCLLHERTERPSKGEMLVYYRVDPLFEEEYEPASPNAARKAKVEPEQLWRDLWAAAHGSRTYENFYPTRPPKRTIPIDQLLST